MPQQYPRKRISVACHYCRHRKRRCDGEKPQCALCRESDIECEYPKQVVEEALSRRETVSQNQKMLLRRLDQLENLLREKSQQPAHTRDDEENGNPEQPNCEVRYDEDADDGESDVGMEDLSYVEHQDVSNDLDARFHQMNESNQPPLFLYPQNLNSLSAAITPDSTIWHETSPASAKLSASTVEIERNAPKNTSEPPEMDDQPFSIPDGHLTTTGSLFLLEPIRRLIGEYPGNFFYHIEGIRKPPFEEYPGPPKEIIQKLNLETKTVDLLLSTFFTEVHINFPILNPETFRIFFYDVMKQGPCESLEMALCLTVLALGKLAFGIQNYGSIHQNKSENGLEYFAPAHQILLSTSWACFDLDTAIPTGLLLSAIYLSYMSYPLPSWSLAYTASVKLQLIISHTKKESLSVEKQEAVDRLCWACFIIECDTLAEFHLPRSGIEYIVHQMQFPYFHQRSTQDELLFLSLCSIRSLLNRIHHAIYAVSRPSRSERNKDYTDKYTVAASPSQESLTSISALECVISELTRQLDTWYSSLPDPIKPELDPQTPCSPVKKWLRSRYWSARHIITRPCLVYAISTTDPGPLPKFVIENSQLCIESCRNFVINAAGALEKPSQYTWNMIQACLSCALVLTAAARSPALQHLISDLDDILNKVISIARRWGEPNSSIQFVDWMLSTVQQRQRLHIVS